MAANNRNKKNPTLQNLKMKWLQNLEYNSENIAGT